MDKVITNLSELFTKDPWTEFDSLPLSIQAKEVEFLRKKYQLFNKRHRRNLRLANKERALPEKRKIEHSPQVIVEIMEAVEQIKKTPECKENAPSNSIDSVAYRMLLEKILDHPENERMFIEGGWLSPYKADRKKEIRRIAKSFQQAAYRYKKKTRT